VHHYAGDLPSWIELRGSPNIPAFSVPVTANSIDPPGDTASAALVPVAATPWNNTTILEPFSAQGPTTDNRIKPDVVGADRGDAASICSGAPPCPFVGTSQAAAHVSGMLALIRQRFPTFT